MSQKRDSLGVVPAPSSALTLVHEDWFEEELLDGIRKLTRHALYMRPSTPEQGAEIAEDWAVALWKGRRWEEKRDASRIRAAFSLLIQGHRARVEDGSKFPTTVDFLSALPKLESQEEPVKPIDPEEAAQFKRTFLQKVAHLKPARPTLEQEMHQINSVLRHYGVPAFRNVVELRRHIARQHAAGSMIANIKIG